MQITSLTIGIPVSDLARSIAWYREVLQLPEPELEPAAGVAEFRLGGLWLQLFEAEVATSEELEGLAATVLRVGVADAAAEHSRLLAAGVTVDELERVPDVIDLFDAHDPDGNPVSFYTELG